MDFLNLVAEQMFDWNAKPDNPYGVQHAMRELMAYYNAQENKSVDVYRIIIQGRIELDKHIQLYGDLDN